MTGIFNRGSVKATKFGSYITDIATNNQLCTQIWSQGVTVQSGQIHGLTLMLFTGGIVELFLTNDKESGREDIQQKHVSIQLAKYVVCDTNGEYNDFVIHKPDIWAACDTKP